MFSSPSISPGPSAGTVGPVWIGSDDFTAYALDPMKLSLFFSMKTGNAIESSPAIDANGNVYVASFDGKVYIFSPAAPGPGKPPYSLSGSPVFMSPIFSSPVVDGSKSFAVGTGSRGVVQVGGQG